MRYVGKDDASFTSVCSVQLSAQKNIAVVKTKVELGSHEDSSR